MRKFTVKPKRAIKASTTFSYSTEDSDPADWYIDYDEFFDLIDECISDLGLEIEEEEDQYPMVGRQCVFTLSNGALLDTYDLECDILYALDDGKIGPDDQKDYICKWISYNC